MADELENLLSREPVGLDAMLGLRLTRIDGDGVDGTLELGAQHHQPFGITHGGVYCAIAESAASVGGYAWFADRGHVVGVANSTNFLRAAREGVLSIAARPLQQGRTMQLWNVEIRDETGRLIATSQVRLANVASTDRIASGGGS